MQCRAAVTIPSHLTNSAVNVGQRILVACACVCIYVRVYADVSRDGDSPSVGRMVQPVLSPLPPSHGETTPPAAAGLAGEDLGAEAGVRLTDGQDADAWCCDTVSV